MENKDTSRDGFESALDALKERSCEVDLASFEHGVWNEIAIRDESGGWLRFLSVDTLLTPAPVTVICSVAVVFGVLLGFSQADAYEKRAALDMEERYVESIHPVMMSASHSHPNSHTER